MHRLRLGAQKGFAALEVVLILVIVTAIGLVGWYVVRAKHNADQSLNNASTSAQTAAKQQASKSAQTTTTLPAGTDNASLSGDLNSINASQTQESQDTTTANNGLNDQQNEVSVPTN